MFGNDPFSRMRARSMVNIGGQRDPSTSPTFQTPYINLEPEDDGMEFGAGNEGSQYFDEIQRIRNNASPALSAYKNALNQAPTPDQFKPSVLQRIGAALAGGGTAYSTGDAGAGMNLVNSVRDRPFLQAQGVYNQRMRGLGEAADIEQEDIKSQIAALTQARALGLKYDEYRLKQLQTQHEMKNKDFTADTGRISAEANASRAQTLANNSNRPDLQFIDQADGSVLQIDKKSGARQVIPAHTVTAMNAQSQRMNAGAAVQNAGTNRLNADTNLRNSDTQSRNVSSLIRTRENPKGTPLAPTQQNAAMDLALREMMADPDFSEFVTQDEKGFYQPISPDDSNMEGYQIFLQALNAKMSQIKKGVR